MLKAVAVPAKAVLLFKSKEAATLVTAAPDPAPSQKTKSELPLLIVTVFPVPCFIIALLDPERPFFIIKNLDDVFGAIVTVLLPQKSESLIL